MNVAELRAEFLEEMPQTPVNDTFKAKVELD